MLSKNLSDEIAAEVYTDGKLGLHDYINEIGALLYYCEELLKPTVLDSHKEFFLQEIRNAKLIPPNNYRATKIAINTINQILPIIVQLQGHPESNLKQIVFLCKYICHICQENNCYYDEMEALFRQILPLPQKIDQFRKTIFYARKNITPANSTESAILFI